MNLLCITLRLAQGTDVLYVDETKIRLKLLAHQLNVVRDKKRHVCAKRAKSQKALGEWVLSEHVHVSS